MNYGAEICTLQGVDVQKSDIGARLKEERERLATSQTDFAALGGVSKRAQITYEKGESTPDAAYLNLVAREGVDVQYVITGVRSSAALTRDEVELVERYRAAPLAVKSAAIGALTAGASPDSAPKFAIDFGSAMIGQNNTVTGGSHAFNVTTKTPRKKK
ncbi:helix-turn-helix domain-containing protein [Burkholderia thailandensis]|uniref:helix-turn-helix domain-containing protein n=1 Tax=Burkholderia thailandensis TaxID=57975 RepID=UPI0005F0EEBF|nr:helix-turn-helix domain-containing protein [Burkholderia thailandensis]